MNLTALSVIQIAPAGKAGPRSAQVPYARATILGRLGGSLEARAAPTQALRLQPGYADAARLLQSLP